MKNFTLLLRDLKKTKRVNKSKNFNKNLFRKKKKN